jgi:transposase
MHAKISGPCASSPILHDVNRQARQWLTEVANQRLNRETRERPVDRFRPML